MKVNQILQQKYPQESDMYGKIESTKVCMLYDDLVSCVFPELAFSRAKSVRGNTLTVTVETHAAATKIKLFEQDIIEQMNQSIDEPAFQVFRVQIHIQSL
jgi:hypothetical protein